MATYEAIKIRRDSTLNWYASNPRLELGELGIDMDLHRMKAGNGIDRWNQLPYLNDDAYTLLNKLTQNLTDTAQDIRHEIEDNKLDAEQKIADMRQDFRTTDASLTSRMKAVETRQTSYEGSLTSRQEEYESEVSGLVSGMRRELDTGLEDFADTKDKLTVRMDVIAGQTTEDTEILDARVDAKDETHPNLGHNIRNIHSKLLELKAELEQKEAELRTYIEEADAELREHTDEKDSELREHVDERDSELQEYIESSKSEQAAVNAELRAYSEDLSAYEERQRQETDEILQEEISQSGEGILQTNLTLSREINERKKSDAELSERITENAGAIQESEQASIVRDNELQDALNAEKDETAQRFSEHGRNLEQEKTERESADDENKAALQHEEETRAAEITELQNRHEELESELSEETRTREASDNIHRECEKILQGQIDELSELGMNQVLKLHGEHEERKAAESEFREGISDNATAIQEETNIRTERDTELSEQITGNVTAIAEEVSKRENSDDRFTEHAEIFNRGQEELSEAIIRTAISSHEGLRKQNENLKAEKAERESADELIHTELNDHTQRLEFLEGDNADIHAEQSALEHLRLDADETAYRAIDELSEGLLTEAISRVNSESRLRSGIESEKAERETEDRKLHEELEATSGHSTGRDTELLRGIDDLTAGVIQNTITLNHEAAQRRKLENVVAGIKSPVDWSKSTSVQIPEPRCAVVNITGINAMPTSKTVELTAYMEFHDMQGNYFRKKILCSAQGNSSMAYIKKNVKFDLLNEDGSEFDMKIGNWPVQDGFHLKAYYTDFFRGVGAVSYKVCDEIMRFNGILRDRPYKKALLDMSSIKTSGTALNNPEDLTLQTDTGALCHPDGFPCIVYLNGVFYGIFSWQIKKHRKNYHLEKSKVEHIHLDGSLTTGYFWDGNINWGAFEIRNPNKLYTMNGKKYDGDAPKELIDETSENYDPENKDHVRSAQVKRYIQNFVARFRELKAKPDREKYEEIFDWENQRDYLIFGDVVKNSDGFHKNWQWFTYDGIKWYVGAYDLDMSFGGHFQGTNITAPLTGHITTSTAIPTGYISRLYNTELEERYRELRDAGIIDADHIARKLEDWVQRISTENYELEYERWPNSPCINYYTDSIYRVRRWLDTEIANMDKIYHYVPEKEQILSGLHEEIDEKVQSEQEQRQAKDESIENYALMETSERKSAEIVLLNEINTLGELNLQQELELRELRLAFKEWVNVVNVIYQDAADTGNLTYKGARIASGNEVTSMLSDVMTGKDSGEVSESEIPEELRDQITTPTELTEMLSEIFPNN